MTLRRHRLRNHLPQVMWSYICPYCRANYMEPASYQQHVKSKHAGYSATFGCSIEDCSFTTMSSRYIVEHLQKNHNVPSNVMEDCSIYLVNDEHGIGYRKIEQHRGREGENFKTPLLTIIPRPKILAQYLHPSLENSDISLQLEMKNSGGYELRSISKTIAPYRSQRRTFSSKSSARALNRSCFGVLSVNKDIVAKNKSTEFLLPNGHIDPDLDWNSSLYVYVGTRLLKIVIIVIIVNIVECNKKTLKSLNNNNQ